MKKRHTRLEFDLLFDGSGSHVNDDAEFSRFTAKDRQPSAYRTRRTGVGTDGTGQRIHISDQAPA